MSEVYFEDGLDSGCEAIQELAAASLGTVVVKGRL